VSPTALQLVVVSIYAAGLSAVGIWHILSGDTTERLFHDPRRVRLVGALMLLMALPCLAWLDRGYFVAMR